MTGRVTQEDSRQGSSYGRSNVLVSTRCNWPAKQSLPVVAAQGNCCHLEAVHLLRTRVAKGFVLDKLILHLAAVGPDMRTAKEVVRHHHHLCWRLHLRWLLRAVSPESHHQPQECQAGDEMPAAARMQGASSTIERSPCLRDPWCI